MLDNQGYKHTLRIYTTFLFYGYANAHKYYVIRAFYLPDGNNGRKVS
jgi:hypothetical protein